MKSLTLLRHAQAVPVTDTIDDGQRALTARGLTQARVLGERLCADGWAPQRILSSSALRAQQTAQGVGAAAGWKLRVDVHRQLFGATPETMMDVLRTQSKSIDRLLVVAHAPGIAELASELTTRRGDLSLVCEPATLIEVVMDIQNWADLSPGCASLRRVLPS